MRLVLSTFIPGTPAPKERPRFAGGQVHSGKKTDQWETHARAVLQFARQQAGLSAPVPRAVPLRLDAEFIFPRVRRLGDGPRARHIVKPDADNILKALKDALDGGRPARGSQPTTPGLIVSDDCQITTVSASKWYAATGEQPGVHLRLWRLDQTPAAAPGIGRRKFQPTDKAPSPSWSAAIRPTGRPHHRWMGGKQKLVGALLAAIPSTWRGRYLAPCLGAGALFYALHGAGRLTGAVLADACAPLIGHLQQLRHNPDALLDQLARHRDQHSPDYWRAARTRFNILIAPEADRHDPQPAALETAGLFLYLNATCFQGMFRLNSDGAFNASLDQSRRPRHILSDARAALMRHNAAALTPVELRVAGLHATIAQAAAGDLLYVDPPYLPRPDQQSFTAYTAEGFSGNDHRLLARSLCAARARGVLVMTSNSTAPAVADLYADGWHIQQLSRPGTASCDPDNRQPVNELLITSWRPEVP